MESCANHNFTVSEIIYREYARRVQSRRKQKINGIRLSDDREISVEGNSVLILDDFEYSSIMNLSQTESKYIIDMLLTINY